MLRDKEMTPVAKLATQKAQAPQSTISRLESKYSDILDRVAKRKQKQQQEKEDRDKTLEPDDYRPAPLMKSQTMANVLKTSDKKERTPFRYDRNKNKYTSDANVKIKQSDLIGLNRSITNMSKHQDPYMKMKSNDSGYYDGGYRGYGKENIYKSKYDPDVMLSELSLSSGNKRTTAATQQQPYEGSSTSRHIRPYKRTESGDKRRTAINLYELLNDEDSEIDNRHQRRHQYAKGKSTGDQLRSDNQRRDFLDLDDEQLDAEKSERENKRKEIQSLIMKYAQMDDFYGKSSVYNNAETTRDNSNVVLAKVDPWDSKNSPIVIPKQSANNQLGKSQTMANISSHYDSSTNYSSWYMSNYNSSNIVPIKTNLTPSSSRSRMSKALSTFVRIYNSITGCFLICCLHFVPLIFRSIRSCVTQVKLLNCSF